MAYERKSVFFPFKKKKKLLLPPLPKKHDLNSLGYKSFRILHSMTPTYLLRHTFVQWPHTPLPKLTPQCIHTIYLSCLQATMFSKNFFSSRKMLFSFRAQLKWAPYKLFLVVFGKIIHFPCIPKIYIYTFLLFTKIWLILLLVQFNSICPLS